MLYVRLALVSLFLLGALGCSTFKHYVSAQLVGVMSQQDGTQTFGVLDMDQPQLVPSDGKVMMDLASGVRGFGLPSAVCIQRLILTLQTRIITAISVVNDRSVTDSGHCFGQEGLEAILLGKALPAGLAAAGQILGNLVYGINLRPPEGDRINLTNGQSQTQTQKAEAEANAKANADAHAVGCQGGSKTPGCAGGSAEANNKGAPISIVNDPKFENKPVNSPVFKNEPSTVISPTFNVPQQPPPCPWCGSGHKED